MQNPGWTGPSRTDSHAPRRAPSWRTTWSGPSGTWTCSCHSCSSPMYPGWKLCHWRHWRSDASWQSCQAGRIPHRRSCLGIHPCTVDYLASFLSMKKIFLPFFWAWKKYFCLFSDHGKIFLPLFWAWKIDVFSFQSMKKIFKPFFWAWKKCKKVIRCPKWGNNVKEHLFLNRQENDKIIHCASWKHSSQHSIGGSMSQ